MAALNYKHLRYFWAVAKSGSIARASDQLHITPQSISGQLSELEGALGAALFRRSGRGLEVTELGRRILGYADEIFTLGDELLEVVRNQKAAVALPFRVGVADSVPKSVTYRVVEPILRLEEPVRLICREGRMVSLLAELAVHRIDMVIADRPMPTDINVRAYNHLLGSSGLTVFAASGLAQTLRGKFPAMLEDAPFLLPGEGTAIRAALEQWFESHEVHPRIVGEFDDGALMKAFGQGGSGLFVAPTAIADDVIRQYGVQVIGRIDDVVEELYAITTERRLRHPATLAVSQAAARDVFVNVAGGGARAPTKSRSPRRRHGRTAANGSAARPGK
jgi:LysR family transcriptional regulator, transcriptional activator of nhaA